MNKPTSPSETPYPEVVAARFRTLPTAGHPTKENTAVFMPLMDGRIEWATVEGLMSTANRYAAVLPCPYCSEISYARNRLFNGFINSPFEWAILLDSDIGFTPTDLNYLLEGTDYAVNGAYPKKDETGSLVTEGLGFARVHRSVLEALIKIPELCLSYVRQNERQYAFCWTGPAGINEVYLGEDQAFWFMLSQVGVLPRIETRVRLKHIGKMAYQASEIIDERVGKQSVLL